MSLPPSREATIVEAVLALEPEQRGSYLDQACSGDPNLRQLVEAMVRAHEQGGLLLQRRAGLGATIPESQSIQPEASQQTGPEALTSPMPQSEKAGDRIGRYRLLQQIGEGGCGVVYMAEQTEPMRRRVALKVIKLGMDTRQVIARFEAERQALAMMEHPNIARVLDGGVTDSGRPFFVMELVRGIPITRYCDEHQLNTAQRLQLFMLVCQAIQHAHQKGIIHRDIKPSNVLVADHDGVAVPKIIDFGIAKVTAGQPLTDKTLFTAFEQFIGTPAYMSPEQAQLSGLELDTRSDVYSLGVLLYELLTGKTPFDPKRLVKAGLDEVRRIIREEDPPRPSTRLSTLDFKEQTAIARHRQSEPPKLLGGIRGDLDWIVMKTLEKDRTRRYGTAEGLAKDIKRHLTNEPVLARPPSKAYRVKKFVVRNKVPVAIGSAFASLVLLAVGVFTFTLKGNRSDHAVAPQPIRIAVLPFSNASPVQVEDYLPGSLLGEVIDTLGSIPGIQALAPPAYLTALPRVEMNTALLKEHVAFVMEGTVRWTEGKVSIDTTLRETRVGAEPLFSTNYTRDSRNMLGVPNSISLNAAEHCLTNLTPAARARFLKSPTHSAEAYDCYLRAKMALGGLMSGNSGSNTTIPLLERAVQLDGQFALAYALLSKACVAKYFYLDPDHTKDLEMRAVEAYTHALQIDTNLAAAHHAVAFVYWTPSQHWKAYEAIAEDSRALELNPSCRDALRHLALICLHVGLFDEVFNLALENNSIDSLDPFTHGLEANALVWQGKYSEAVEAYRRVAARFGQNFIGNSYVAIALINLDQTNEATNLIHESLNADPNDTGGLFASVQAVLLAKQGDEPGAIRQIQETLKHRKGFGHFHHALYNIATAYALLKKDEPAINYLREAASNGFPCYPLFASDRNLKSLYQNEKFKDFLTEQQQIHEHFKAQFRGHNLPGTPAQSLATR